MPEPVGMNGHRLPATPEGRREAHVPAKPAPAAPPAKSAQLTSSAAFKQSRDELEVLIRARYPIIYVVTWEEERLEQRLLEIAKKRNKSLHVWTCSQGMVQFGADPQRSKGGSGSTCDPVAGLDAVLAYVEPGIFLFKDLHDHLDTRMCTGNLRNIRRLRDVAHALRDTYKTVVLVSPIMKIPVELSKDVAVVEFGTPSVDDFNGLLDRIIDDVKDQPRISINLDVEGREKLVHAARGLTLKEAENVFAKTLVLDGKLDADDISVVFSEKQQIIRKSGTLEYYESQEKFASVAGLENLKDWLKKRSAAFSDRAAQFGLPAPKGVLLLGVQGCGKSLCAKAASSLWKLPLLRFDIGTSVRQPGGLERRVDAAGPPDGRERRSGDPLDR